MPSKNPSAPTNNTHMHAGMQGNITTVAIERRRLIISPSSL
jgi:hypothetical protein